MTTEDDVRHMLERRSGDVSPGTDGWDRIEERLGEHRSPRSTARSPRRAFILAGAAVVAVGGLVLAIRPGRDHQLVSAGLAQTADGGPQEESTTTTSEPSSTTALPAEPQPLDAPTTAVVAPPPPPGAPKLVSAAAAITERRGAYAQGTISVTFDQPVELASPDMLIAMRLVVFEDDPSCTGPDGNSHELLSGNGTPTLTLDATSLKGPTTYIQIMGGFVRSVGSGTENGSTDCIAVPTTG